MTEQSLESSLPLHQRKLYGDQLRSENILLENINEEVLVNSIPEQDENEDNSTSHQVDNDDEVFDSHNIDAIYNIQKRQKKCCTKNNCLRCCRLFTTFMFSRVGFSVIMIGYLFVGGLIFQELESEFENSSMQRGEKNVDNMVNKIYERIIENSIEIHDDSFHEFLTYEIGTFRDFVKTAAMNGTLISTRKKQWTLVGSIFYAVTLLSMVGYGNITCKTRNGKIFTIVYSTIGVPLMLLFFSNAGSSTATVFKFFYIKFDSIRRRCKMSAYERRQLRNFDFDNDRFLEFSQSDFDKGDDIISSISIQDLKKEIKKKKKTEKKTEKKTGLKMNKISNNNEKTFDENENQNKKDQNDSLAKFSLPSFENTFDSLSYAQHVQGKYLENKNIITDLDLNLPKSLNPNQEKNPIDSLLNEKRTISLLETSNITTFDGKIGDVMKRIDNLISTEIIVQPETLPETLNSDNRLKIFSIIGKQNSFERDKSTDNDDDLKINVTVNPIELISPKLDLPKVSEEKQSTKKSRSFFKAFSGKNKKLQSKDENIKKSTESVVSTKDEILKKNDSSMKKVKSESKFSKKKTETEPKIQINQNFVDPNLETPEYSENDLDVKKRRNSFFSRNKTVSLKSSQKKIDSVSDEDRRKSEETLCNKNSNVSDGNNNFLKPNTIISKSPTNSTNSVPQVAVNSSIKKDESNKSLKPSNTSRFPGRKLSYQMSTTSDRHSGRSPSVNHFPFSRNQWQFIYHDFHQRHQQKAGVPLLLALVIPVLYLVAATILFSEIENWDKLDALYFSFVTFATIGFGDFIPGLNSLSLHTTELHLSISAIYIIVSGILLFTCYNLTKNEFKNKIQLIARRFGL